MGKIGMKVRYSRLRQMDKIEKECKVQRTKSCE